jgi:hypothetical protein
MESSIFNSHEHSANSFLKHILDGLDKAEISYCVERNYQDYPTRITGDVDLLVSAEDLHSAVLKTFQIAKAQNWKPYISHKTSQSAHIGFYADLYPKRFVLVVEFFVGGSWRGFCFLNAKRVLKSKEKYGLIWKPHSSHEAIITLVHHLLYNDKVYEKYRESIYNLHNSDPSMFRKELATIYGVRIANMVSENIAVRNWSELEIMSSQLRKVLIMRSFMFSFRKTLLNLISLYLKVRSKPRGLLILIHDQGNHALDFSKAIIDVAKKWHIFIPPNRVVIRWGTSPAINQAKQVNKVISSGGIVIVVCESVPDLQSSKDLTNYVQPGVTLLATKAEVSLILGKKSYVINNANPDSMAYSFWNIVLQSYSLKV